MSPSIREFFHQGWCRFPQDPALAAWVRNTLSAARKTVTAPENAQWHRCGGTWFAGVNVLPNNKHGAVEDGPPIGGQAVDFIRDNLDLGVFEWDHAQVSVCYPGYPKPMAEESKTAFGYRLNRDAAHVDGFAREGPERRRFLREHHSFLLGIPMVETCGTASPLVVWDGSHEIVRTTFQKIYEDLPPERWADIDVTERYHEVRRKIFATCRRVMVSARPGEAYLVHRLALHGMAPWDEAASAGQDGRMVVYFRPATGGPHEWLHWP